jgi:hypothetical protein
MAHFAKLDENNIVTSVIVVHNNELLDVNGVESEIKGIEFCKTIAAGEWIQTSYSGKFRKNFAGIGYTYDSNRDAFIPPKPQNFPSWVLDEDSCKWVPPIPYPLDGKKYPWDEIEIFYLWKESSLSWEKHQQEQNPNQQM